MQARSLAVAAASLALSALMLGCVSVYPDAARGCATPGAHPVAGTASAGGSVSAGATVTAKPPEQHHLYRLELVVSSVDPGKPAVNTTFTLNVEDNHTGELRLGSNIVLSPSSGGSSPRQDVGIMLRCNVVAAGDDLILHCTTELSSAEDAPTIRKITANGDAVATPGKATPLYGLEDPISHKRYEVTVTATRLR